MLQACNFIKKETLAQVFSCEFCEISKNNFSTEHFQKIASGHSAFYNDLIILIRWNKMFLVELKESLLIVREQPSLNRNIISTSS